MSKAILTKWKSSRFLRYSVIIFAISFLLSLYLQNVAGADPLTSGELVMGDADIDMTIPASSTLSFTGNLTEQNSVFAMAAQQPIAYYLIEGEVTSTNSSMLEELAFESGNAASFSLFMQGDFQLSVVFVNDLEEDLIFGFIVREYTESDMAGILLYSIGSILRTGAFLVAGIYLFFGLAVPWFRGSNQRRREMYEELYQRSQAQQTEQTNQQVVSGKKCAKCGANVDGLNFCETCGEPVPK